MLSKILSVLLNCPRFGYKAKIVHFIGPVKPWQHRYVHEVDSVILYPGTYGSQHAAQDLVRRWWHVFISAEQVMDGEWMKPNWEREEGGRGRNE